VGCNGAHTSSQERAWCPVAAGLRDRLAALDRALRRVEDGSYGRSIRSGAPIPDERLEADPAAELTVQEAAGDQAADR
jgi:RNA polymerase-binding transcription factor